MAGDGEKEEEYDRRIEALREREYPMLKDITYLDHAGTTPYPKSLIERFSADMLANLYGNPHSASPSSQLSTRRIEDIRLRVVRFFNADPDEFDIVFVANATAGIKLIMDAFRDNEAGFWFGYHKDSHTSIVGVREAATAGHRCFSSDQDVEDWLSVFPDRASFPHSEALSLFAYPAQSNMNGRRLPLDWCQKSRWVCGQQRPVYTLLDVAALISTSPFDLSNANAAADFTVLSFYKIFGFPDLGALIIRKASSSVLRRRRYFGGGTVDLVTCLKEQWHIKKTRHLHDELEDGTLPIHNIMALDNALDVHRDLFHSLDAVSRHTSYLAKKMHDGLASLRHGNGAPVCEIYEDSSSSYGDVRSQGPIVAFNLRNRYGAYFSNAEVEKLASIKNIHLRTGGLCNPGGLASALRLEPWEMKQNFSAGQRCGGELDIMNGKPIGMIRVSLGASSVMKDVEVFLTFVQEFFVNDSRDTLLPPSPPLLAGTSSLYVESLTIYPIKSCAGWKIPAGQPWAIRTEGLQWDREWCLVHQGTGTALSQKRYPRMALIRPSIDLKAGVMRVRTGGTGGTAVTSQPDGYEIVVPLSADPSCFTENQAYGIVKHKSSQVCGDSIVVQIYQSPMLADFFTAAVGVPCQLARFPPGDSTASSRHSKLHLQDHQQRTWRPMPGEYPDARYSDVGVTKPILLSNESPILTVSRSSLNQLNGQIKANGGKAVEAEVFRANILLAEDPRLLPGNEQPYVEDSWRSMQIGHQRFRLLGPCRRCQMVCIDQNTAQKNEEPFVTLAKTRRFNGRVYFGQHTCYLPSNGDVAMHAQNPTVSVGDPVRTFTNGDHSREDLDDAL